MRTVLFGLLLLACVAGSTGCGTVGNVLGPRQYPHYYGGVEFDYLAMRGTWSSSKTDESNATGSPEDLGKVLCLTALIAMDFPLSFIGDTITLPGVLLQSGFRGGWDKER
jgi:uncharacterized protein YceK